MYSYKENFIPLDVKSNFWELKSRRSRDFDLIFSTLERNKNSEFAEILTALENDDAEIAEKEPRNFLEICCRRNLTLGWFIDVCANKCFHLEDDSNICSLLISLIYPFEPIRVETPCTEYQVELGKIITLWTRLMSKCIQLGENLDELIIWSKVGQTEHSGQYCAV